MNINMNMNMNINNNTYKHYICKVKDFQPTDSKSSSKSTGNLKTNYNNNDPSHNNFDARLSLSKKRLSVNPTNILFENKCKKECENFKILLEKEITIKELNEENEKLKLINDYLVKSLNNKEELFMSVSKELNHAKSYIAEIKNREKNNLIRLSFNNNHHHKNISHDNGIEILNNKKSLNRNSKNCVNMPVKLVEKENPVGDHNEPESQKIIRNNHVNRHKTVLLKNDSIPNIYRPSLNINSNFNSSQLNNILSNKVSLHYQKLSDIGRNLSRKYQNHNGRSFLSLNDDEFLKLINLNLQKEIYELTFSDDDFINTMRNASDDKLISYCDVIGSVIKDFTHGIKLIQRIKHFLKISVNFVKSMLIQETTACLIRNTCEILNCERTSLFVHEKNSNMLIVHTGDHLKKSEIKVPKDKGIVGACFESGKKIKVDDAYLDERFNKEIDKLTGYKSKSLLCMPLIDNDGEIFGVIESVNKRGGVFDKDDEELMEIFSGQASVVLKSSMNFDLNAIYTYRLKLTIEYTIDLDNIQSIGEFTFMTESFIMTLFNNTKCKFIFYDPESTLLYHFSKFNHSSEIPKVGLVNYVLKIKDYYGCNSMDDFYYNSLADIETVNSIITFPILQSNNGEDRLIAIVQFAYNDKLIGDRGKMCEYDMNILEFYKQITLRWIQRRDKSFYKI